MAQQFAVSLLCNSLQQQAKNTLSELKKGKEERFKTQYAFQIKGKKLTVKCDLKIYNGYGSKGYTGDIQISYGSNYMKRHVHEIDDLGNAVWNWIKSWWS